MRIRNIAIMALLAIAATGMVVSANANLVPTVFGFPTTLTNDSYCAFKQDRAICEDIENISIHFPPTFNSTVLGPSGFGGGVNLPDGTQFGGGGGFNQLEVGPLIKVAFPSIDQNVTQIQDISHTEFVQHNILTESTYPYIGVGG